MWHLAEAQESVLRAPPDEAGVGLLDELTGESSGSGAREGDLATARTTRQSGERHTHRIEARSTAWFG